jgi:3-oxoadipate CoA-transferase beta subunit
MDLAVGAREVWVMMEHTSKKREPKIVRRCTLPLTGSRVVDRIYSDLARIDVTPQGLVVRAMVPGLDADTLQALTHAPLRFDEPLAVLGV